MNAQERKILDRWHKNYSWLWAILPYWNGVIISARRTNLEDLLQTLKQGKIWFVGEIGDRGPFVSPVKEECLISESRVETMLRGFIQMIDHEIERRELKYLVQSLDTAAVYPNRVTILKPPAEGWNDLIRQAAASYSICT